jgi:hypothetical protein
MQEATRWNIPFWTRSCAAVTFFLLVPAAASALASCCCFCFCRQSSASFHSGEQHEHGRRLIAPEEFLTIDQIFNILTAVYQMCKKRCCCVVQRNVEAQKARFRRPSDLEVLRSFLLGCGMNHSHAKPRHSPGSVQKVKQKQKRVLRLSSTSGINLRRWGGSPSENEAFGIHFGYRSLM